jgi:hypothetical protein
VIRVKLGGPEQNDVNSELLVSLVMMLQDVSGASKIPRTISSWHNHEASMINSNSFRDI